MQRYFRNRAQDHCWQYNKRETQTCFELKVVRGWCQSKINCTTNRGLVQASYRIVNFSKMLTLNTPWYPPDHKHHQQGEIWMSFVIALYELCSNSEFAVLYAIHIRNHGGYGLSHWETTLHYNIVCHWLSPYTIWSLHFRIHDCERDYECRTIFYCSPYIVYCHMSGINNVPEIKVQLVQITHLLFNF